MYVRASTSEIYCIHDWGSDVSITTIPTASGVTTGGTGGGGTPPPPPSAGKKKVIQDTHTWVSIPRGMGGGIYPPNILGGGWPVLSSPPPQYFTVECHIIPDKISEVPTNIMKEIAGFKCRNATIFLARSARSHT